MTLKFLNFVTFLLFAVPGLAMAQGAQIAFGNLASDGSHAIEITADQLDVDQDDSTAVFSGNVIIARGEMRLSASSVRIIYLESRDGIERLEARGGVTLVSGQDAAEAARADYNVETGIIEMEGDVLLLQGSNALSAQRMTVNTRSGTARMSGRVKTVIRQGEDAQ